MIDLTATPSSAASAPPRTTPFASARRRSSLSSSRDSPSSRSTSSACLSTCTFPQTHFAVACAYMAQQPVDSRSLTPLAATRLPRSRVARRTKARPRFQFGDSLRSIWRHRYKVLMARVTVPDSVLTSVQLHTKCDINPSPVNFGPSLPYLPMVLLSCKTYYPNWFPVCPLNSNVHSKNKFIFCLYLRPVYAR